MKYDWTKEMLAAEGTVDPKKVTKIHTEWIGCDADMIRARYWEMFPETLDKYHLAELIKKTIEKRPDLCLPKNLYTQTDLQGWTWGRRTRVENANELAKSIRRFCGWLEALPGAREKKIRHSAGSYKWFDCERDDEGCFTVEKTNRFIRGTGRGAGSDYEPHWWRIFNRHSSPGGLIKWRQQAWSTAAMLLKPFGLLPCKGTRKQAFFPVLLSNGNRRPRRAGFQWAAATLLLLAKGKWSIAGKDYYDRFPSYSESRDLLVRVARIKVGTVKQRTVAASMLGAALDHNWVEDNSDGVSAIITEQPLYERLGIQLYEYITESGDFGVMVKRGNRTYHRSGVDITQKRTEKYYWKSCVSIAINAWRRQDEVAAQRQKEKAELLAQVHPQGPCELVVLYSDSRRAGNCHTGTMGFSNKVFGAPRYAAPYDLVARYSDWPEVKRVLNSL